MRNVDPVLPVCTTDYSGMGDLKFQLSTRRCLEFSDFVEFREIKVKLFLC